MQYYEEMGTMLQKGSQESELQEAHDCWKKALEISISIHGATAFKTVNCHLSLASILEKLGMHEESEAAMQECLSRFDSANDQMRDDRASEGSNSRGIGGARANANGHDASLLQRIGICFRERKEYERSCELLERVLQVRKRIFISAKRKGGQSSDQLDVDEFSGKVFAHLYNDLALTYQGMEDLEYAQEYLVLAIQCLEKLQDPAKA